MAGENGNDGMGGTVTQPTIADDPDFASGPEFEMDPGPSADREALGLEPAPAGAGDGEAGGADPWAGYSDETRELADRKGWKTPEDQAKAYREMESLIGKQGAERGDLEQQVANLTRLTEQLAAATPQQAQQQGAPAPGEVDWMDFAARGGFDVNDPDDVKAVRAVQLYHSAYLPQILDGLGNAVVSTVDQSVGGRLAPVERHMNQTQLKDEATALMADFPDDFPRYREEIVSAVKRNPNLSIRHAFLEAWSSDVAKQQKAARRGQEGETLTGGGGPSRGRQPARDVPAEVRLAIESAIGGAAIGGGQTDGMGGFIR